MKLSIIIVSWNVLDKLRKNLEQLYLSEVDFEFEVFVVDNNSGDSSVEMVRAEFPQVNMIVNQDNLGFARANNMAIKKTNKTGAYILLLNPDMIVERNTLQQAVNWMDSNQQAAVSGIRLESLDGQILPHVRRFPTMIDQLMIILKLPHVFKHVLDSYLRLDFDYSMASRVDSVRGSFFLMRRFADELPLLDERYFIWFEEVDYCRQMKLQGREVWYNPVATCIDLVGGSFSQVERGTTQIYFRNSMLLYFKKWHSKIEYGVLYIAWPVGIIITALGSFLKITLKHKT